MSLLIIVEPRYDEKPLSLMFATIKFSKPLRPLLVGFLGRTASPSVTGKVRTTGKWGSLRLLEQIVAPAHSSRSNPCVTGPRMPLLHFKTRLMHLYVLIPVRSATEVNNLFLSSLLRMMAIQGHLEE
jgi:hypothetical protein